MGDLGARCWRECQDLMTICDRGLLMGLEGGWMGAIGGCDRRIVDMQYLYV
ncbi:MULTISPECIES: hypothetical protein [unclassified Tychonema]|uniref:hypothetical protein n=1 Tax=unclassified Tychonema TaxID=2642144 RepID=UPI00187FB4D1|nr:MULTISPECIES: hypothetical protein [unclassified Tychonema]MBE9095946.1 hypothetical protein [Tychonema sp. LEGE 07203]MBE9120067.1 hypothetical protein [Tychonema sp. LEGE 07199]MBE9132851.1 hypothetical protein [Tychonema sp. LEGE 07196]